MAGPNGNLRSRERIRVSPHGGGWDSTRIEKAAAPKKALGRMIRYLRPYLPGLSVVFILVVLYTLAGLLGPYLMGVAIDQYIIEKDLTGFTSVIGWMFVSYMVSTGLQAVSNWIMARISQEALQAMRKDLFEHLQKLSLSYFDRNPAGELMSRLTNDIDAINQAVSQNVTSLFASLLSLVGILITMFVLNVWLALASVIVVPVMFWFTQFVARYTRRGFRDLQRDLGQLNSAIEEAVSGQRVVQAFRRSDATLDRFRAQNKAAYKSGMFANTYSLMLMPITNILGNFFVIVLAGLGGWLALQNLVTVGTIATFINYGQRFIQPLRQIANMYNSIQAALAGAERVFDVLDTQPEIYERPDARPLENVRGEVCLENVHFGYLPDVPVLKNMTLTAQPGETVALVGPTGAGKTTIINLLHRFYDIQGGSIRIDGEDIRDLRLGDLRNQLGLVLQDTFLFSDTVLENIRYGRLEATDQACIEAAKMAGADIFIRQLPHGYQTVLSERASNLSQGQRQLLTIARAILADPAILVLDEATSSVDTRTEARIQKALLRLMEGRTSFVIAHRLSTIRDAHRVVVIHGGEIVEQGSHQELMDLRGFYHHLYMSQFKGQEI